jgi:hypothetical protein
MRIRRSIGPAWVLAFALPAFVHAQAPAKKTNILVIWGDDIGWYNPGIPRRST